MPPKKCCCGECDGCPCDQSACFQIVDPPTLALCSTHPIATGVANVAIAGVMQYQPLNDGMDDCAWWCHYCAPYTDTNYTAYALEMYLDDFCRMRLAFWVACNLTKEECCAYGIRPPHVWAESDPRWHRVVLYKRALFDAENCNDETPITFDKVSGSTGCQAECESFGGLSSDQFPSTIDVIGLETCPSPPTPGGEECAPDEPDGCCDIDIDTGNLVITFASSCPDMDGLTFTLPQVTPTRWFLFGAGLTGGDGTLCGDHCYFNILLECFIDGGLTYWNLAWTTGCNNNNPIPNGCGQTSVPTDAPIDMQCDPLSLVFTRHVPTGGSNSCGGCTGCTVTATVTR